MPTIQRYEDDKKRQEQELDAEIEPAKRSGSNATNATTVSEKEERNMTEGQKEKKQMMDKMNASKQKPTDTVKHRKGERVVDDPVTGEKVIIKDAQFKGEHRFRPSFAIFVRYYLIF